MKSVEERSTKKTGWAKKRDDKKEEEGKILGASSLIHRIRQGDSDQGPTKRRRCPRLPPQLSRTAHLPPPPLYNQSSVPRRESRTFLHVFAKKPLSEILDRTAYAKPASFSDATSRMQKNLNYFKINYMIATLGILSAFILYHPSSLLILSAISAAWCYVFMIDKSL